MKKVSLLLSFLLWGAFLVSAQDVQDVQTNPNVWFDFQIAQSFGLNDWNRVQFASDRLPRPSFSTDLRATFNVYIARPVGFFCDMGVGVMPAPRNGLSDPTAQAALATGISFYTKEMTTEEGYQTVNAHFKMTFGLFGQFSVADKLSVSPYFGIGFMTISAPTCEAVLKERDANMQYIARYQWFRQDENGTGTSNSTSLGYLAGRLRFTYHVSPKLNLLFGAEYTWHFTRADFSETYTNYFNYNITKTIDHKGNCFNMLGLSVGVSFLIEKKQTNRWNNIFNL